MKTLTIELGRGFTHHNAHVDVKVHFLRDLDRDGHVKLLKCAGPQNVSDYMRKVCPVQHLRNTRVYGRNEGALLSVLC